MVINDDLMVSINMGYPLVICYVAMENDHRNSRFAHEKMMSFHSYVKLPEATQKWLVYDDGENISKLMI